MSDCPCNLLSPMNGIASAVSVETKYVNRTGVINRNRGLPMAYD